jgi:hypothetical protein
LLRCLFQRQLLAQRLAVRAEREHRRQLAPTLRRIPKLASTVARPRRGARVRCACGRRTSSRARSRSPGRRTSADDRDPEPPLAVRQRPPSRGAQ